MLAQSGLGIPRQQIVIFIVPHQRQRADDVKRALFPIPALLGDGVFKVVKTDLPIPGNGVGDLVDIIINALVHALDAAVDIELRIIDAGKTFDFFDKGQRLFVRDEFRRLHAVDQQLELRHFKRARADIIPGRARFRLHDVQPEDAQRLQIVIDALALRRNAVLGKLRDHLRHGHRVALVRLLQQDLHQAQ